jgi:hypothetical protein
VRESAILDGMSRTGKIDVGRVEPGRGRSWKFRRSRRELVMGVAAADGAWWLWWSWADQLAQIDDVDTAAFKIAYVLTLNA